MCCMLFQLSKAAMLHKGAEYIRQLRSDRQTLKEEIESLKQQVESLNSAIRYTTAVFTYCTNHTLSLTDKLNYTSG